MYTGNCKTRINDKPFGQAYPQHMNAKQRNLRRKHISESRRWHEFYKKNRNGPFAHTKSGLGFFSKNKEIYKIGRKGLVMVLKWGYIVVVVYAIYI